MPYVDGFVLSVPKDRLEDYRRHAHLTGQIWMEHGALSFVQCIADDVPYGERTSFPRAVEARDDEVVVLAWVTYKSRQHRDAVMAKVSADGRSNMDRSTMPFDTTRMIFGGFDSFIAL